jgi:serine/threonine protein kinase
VRVFICKRTNEKVAVKVVKKSKSNLAELFDQLNEYYLLKNLDNPYVIKVRELFETETELMIVMNFIEGQNLA